MRLRIVMLVFVAVAMASSAAFAQTPQKDPDPGGVCPAQYSTEECGQLGYFGLDPIFPGGTGGVRNWCSNTTTAQSGPIYLACGECPFQGCQGYEPTGCHTNADGSVSCDTGRDCTTAARMCCDKSTWGQTARTTYCAPGS